MPAAKPDKILPTMREKTRRGSAVVAGGERPLAAAIISQPTIEGIVEIKRVFRRPLLLSIGPTTKLPTRAPKLIILEKKAINPSPISNWAETDEEYPNAIPIVNLTCNYISVNNLTANKRTGCDNKKCC